MEAFLKSGGVFKSLVNLKINSPIEKLLKTPPLLEKCLHIRNI
jgi:hypothetical protein